jgi:hypothetical protein
MSLQLPLRQQLLTNLKEFRSKGILFWFRWEIPPEFVIPQPIGIIRHHHCYRDVLARTVDWKQQCAVLPTLRSKGLIAEFRGTRLADAVEDQGQGIVGGILNVAYRGRGFVVDEDVCAKGFDEVEIMG